MAGTSTSMKGQSKIQLYLLSDDEALILLQKHARIDHDSASSLLYEVTREIARECKGVPLAIEAVGTSLRGKSTNEWKIALDRLRDSKPVGIEGGVRDVFACVILSYDHLRSSLAKSLFLLCGLFPEDHKISKEDVFRYAVGLDLCGDVMLRHWTQQGTV
ncbi:putative disease resistance protein [Spatholobus suberectus]|nr:putative disease resistance protein [Spatholobus suberectus]